MEFFPELNLDYLKTIAQRWVDKYKKQSVSFDRILLYRYASDYQGELGGVVATKYAVVFEILHYRRVHVLRSTDTSKRCKRRLRMAADDPYEKFIGDTKDGSYTLYKNEKSELKLLDPPLDFFYSDFGNVYNKPITIDYKIEWQFLPHYKGLSLPLQVRVEEGKVVLYDHAWFKVQVESPSIEPQNFTSISATRLMQNWGIDTHELVQLLERGLPAYRNNTSLIDRNIERWQVREMAIARALGADPKKAVKHLTFKPYEMAKFQNEHPKFFDSNGFNVMAQEPIKPDAKSSSDLIIKESKALSIDKNPRAFIRRGKMWEVRFDGESIFIDHNKPLRYVLEVLKLDHGKPIGYVRLAQLVEGTRIDDNSKKYGDLEIEVSGKEHTEKDKQRMKDALLKQYEKYLADPDKHLENWKNSKKIAKNEYGILTKEDGEELTFANSKWQKEVNPDFNKAQKNVSSNKNRFFKQIAEFPALEEHFRAKLISDKGYLVYKGSSSWEIKEC